MATGTPGRWFSAASKARPNRRAGLSILLFSLGIAGLAAPGLLSWLTELGQRPWEDHLTQMIAALFLLLAIAKSERKIVLSARPNPVGLGLILLSGLLYIFGLWFSIQAAIFIGLLSTLITLCWTWCGNSGFYRALPGFLFALFLLPQVPTDIRTTFSLPLQLLSTKLATGLAGLFIPIQTQGITFYVQGEVFKVTAAESGLNIWLGYLFAGMLVMLMNRFSLGRLGRLLLAAPLLALAGNVLRLWATAMLAYWVSADAGLAIQAKLEYIIFSLGMLLMVLAESQIEKRFPLAASPKTEVSASRSPKANIGLAWATGLLLLAINAGVWLGSSLSIHPASTNDPVAALPSIPYQVGAWHGRDLPLLHDEATNGATATFISREYTIGSPQTGQPQLWMNLIEAPTMDAVPKVVDELIASGVEPRLLGTIVIQTGKGPLKASWYRCLGANGLPYHMLLWYEWRGGNAENRWAWYWNVLQLKLQRQQPVWRLVELSSPGAPAELAPEQARRLEQLKAFAAEIYRGAVP